MASNDNKKALEVSQPRARQPVRHIVSELLQGGREAILEHNGFEYHLRVTASGRLILTK